MLHLPLPQRLQFFQVCAYIREIVKQKPNGDWIKASLFCALRKGDLTSEAALIRNGNKLPHKVSVPKEIWDQHIRYEDFVTHITKRTVGIRLNIPQNYYLHEPTISIDDIDVWLNKATNNSADKKQPAQKVSLPRVPSKELEAFLKNLKQELGKVPAKHLATTKAKAHFPTYTVLRKMVFTAHEKVFGKMSPGPRKNK